MLTRSGLGTAVVGIAAAVCGVWWGYEELVLIGICLGLFIAFAILIAQRPLRASVTRRVDTIRVPRGDPIRLTYRIRNDTRFRSSRFTVIDRCDDQVTATDVEPVAPDGVTDVHATIATRRRGVFPVGPLDIERVDPFFLSIGQRRDARHGLRPTAVTIHPKIYELVGPQGAMRSVESEAVIRRATNDPLSGFVSMREYIAGDDPRMIHWPTTARVGSLMVREHVEVRRPEFTIVLDTAEDVGSDDDFEEAVDVAATLAVHALRSGLDVVVRTTDAEHLGRQAALTAESEVLDLLTPVRRSASENLVQLPALFTHGFDHTAIVMVTGPSGPSSRVAASERMTTVRIGEGAQSGGSASFAADGARDFVQRWRSWS